MHVIAGIMRSVSAWFGVWIAICLLCERLSIVAMTGPVVSVIAVMAALFVLALECITEL